MNRTKEILLKGIRIKMIARQALLLTFCLFLTACGGGSDTSQEPPPAPISPPTPAPSPTPAPLPTITDSARTNAARLLTQATFGPSFGQVEETAVFLVENDVATWVDMQAQLPASSHLDVALQFYDGTEDLPNPIERSYRLEAWWRAALLGDDQLRQRIAFALSQLFVVSENSQLANVQFALANYYDLFSNNAFGNYRDIMEDVTKSPVMGLYLSMMGNEKAQPEFNIRPDENYARELMQLFSIGLVELNSDGSVKIDGDGVAIPTYDQPLIEAYASVFTGWHFAGKNAFNWNRFFIGADFFAPMEVVNEFHDQNEKQLINGYLVPAGTSAEESLQIALDSLFLHPNLPPFVARHFIQHLVTSNPSPDYVLRVASTFADNGEGMRGDLLATIKAVLTDDEARSVSQLQLDTFGRTKQPLLRLTQLLRALISHDQPPELPNDETALSNLINAQFFVSQSPLGAPSVFNFFLPDHKVNGELSELLMVVPEMQMYGSNNIVRNSNIVAFLIYGQEGERLRRNLNIDLSQYVNLLENDTFYEQINFTLLQGQMSQEFIDVLRSYEQQLARVTTPELTVSELLFLITTSPQFAVQQ